MLKKTVSLRKCLPTTESQLEYSSRSLFGYFTPSRCCTEDPPDMILGTSLVDCQRAAMGFSINYQCFLHGKLLSRMSEDNRKWGRKNSLPPFNERTKEKEASGPV